METKILAPTTSHANTTGLFDNESFSCLTIIYCKKNRSCAAAISSLLRNGRADNDIDPARIKLIISKICRLVSADLLSLKSFYSRENHRECCEHELAMLLKICNESIPEAFIFSCLTQQTEPEETFE